MSIFGLQLIVGTWLVGRLFPLEGQGECPLRLKSNYLRGARWSSQLIVTVGALYSALESVAADTDFSVTTSAFLICPLAFFFRANGSKEPAVAGVREKSGIYTPFFEIIQTVVLTADVFQLSIKSQTGGG